MTTTTIHEGNSATLELLAGYVLTVTADQAASSNCAVKRSRIFAALDETVVTTETVFGPYFAAMTMVLNCDAGNVSFSAAPATDAALPVTGVVAALAALAGFDDDAVLTVVDGVPTWVAPA